MAFSTTKFPVPAWKLMPSFKPAVVTVICEASDGYKTNLNWRMDKRDLFHTKAEAIAKGNVLLDEQQARLDKAQAAIDKKRAELAKAEATP